MSADVGRGAPIHVEAGSVEGPPSISSSVQELLAPLNKAVKAIRRGDDKAALRLINEVVADRPEHGPAEIILASLYWSEGLNERSRQSLEQATIRYPQDPEPHLIFGDMALNERRISDASVQYQRALVLAEEFTGAPQRQQRLKAWGLGGLGSVAEARKQLEEARGFYVQLVELDPQHAQGRFRLGHVLFALGRIDDAVKEFRSARELNDSAPSVELTVAGLCIQSGNDEQAEIWLQRAMDTAPQDPTPWISMAGFLVDVRHDPERAARFASQAEKLAPNQVEPLLLRGLIAWKAGDLAVAEQAFEKAAFQAPSHVEANCFLASVLAEQPVAAARRRRARELAAMTVANNPQSVEAVAALGWVEFLQGSFAEAERHLRAATQAGAAGRDVKYYLARLLFRGGHVAEAQQLLQDALAAKGPFIHLQDARKCQSEFQGVTGGR